MKVIGEFTIAKETPVQTVKQRLRELNKADAQVIFAQGAKENKMHQYTKSRIQTETVYTAH